VNFDDPRLLDFLAPQMQAHGGNVEIDDGLWSLFAVEATDLEGNAIARSLLEGAPFPHQIGPSADDYWMLYYVDTASRAEAIHWLDDLRRRLAGEIRLATPAERELVRELTGSNMPHRVAQRLAESHGKGELSAGAIRDPAVVRALLDRLHAREPLYFSAFQILLCNHLIDMVVLFQQLIAEDVSLENEIVKSSLSRDPFLQTRQAAATEIRNFLIRFHIINPLDQLKATAIDNPYATYLEIVRSGDRITAPIDGTTVTVLRSAFINAIHSIRKILYRGEAFETLDTQAPWMNEEIAYSFRFIKQRADSRRDLSPMDVLFMLERSVEV
jgi:hypothetical protein